jgi:hypothetical protein
VKTRSKHALSNIRRGSWGRALAAVLSLVVFLAATPRAALAQDKRTRAKALLVEGGSLIQSGDYSEALTRFERAYALVPSPKIFFNYGLAYVGLDRPSEAIHYFEAFIAEAGDAPPANVAKAREYLAKLSKKVTVVELTGETEGAEVSVDGKSYQNSAKITVDPGVHQLTVDKSGRTPFLYRLTANPGERVVVTVHFPDAAPAQTGPLIGPIPRSNAVSSGTSSLPPPQYATPSRDTEEQRDVPATSSGGGNWQTTAGWVSAGVAVAFLGGGLAARMIANKKYADFNATKVAADPNHKPYPIVNPDHCNKSIAGDSGSPTCQQLLSQGDTYSSLSWVGFIGGGVLAVAAVIFFATAPSGAPAHQSDTAFSCAPTVGMIGAGCFGRF